MALEDFGVRVGVAVHFRSDKTDQEGCVNYTFGVGKMPTKADVDAAVRECLTSINDTLGVDDARLTHLGDQGFAREFSLEWAFDEPARDAPPSTEKD